MPCLLEVLMIQMIDTITLIPVKTGRVTLTSLSSTILTSSDSVKPPLLVTRINILVGQL